MPRTDQQLALPDGRRLGYDEHGDPSGRPLLYFRGAPSARVEWDLFGTDDLLRRLNLRLFALDRPGMGLSDFQPNRRIGDWTADVAAFADQLGLDRFAVLGFSAGTPYASACALKIPARLTAVGLVSVMVPFDVPGATAGINPRNLQFIEMCRDKPRLGRIMQAAMGLTARYAPDRLIARAMAGLPEPDQAVLREPTVQRAFVRMVRECMRHGPRGPQLDMALMASPWDFDPARIRMPMRLWQGEQDRNAPPAMARYLAASIASRGATPTSSPTRATSRRWRTTSGRSRRRYTAKRFRG